MKIHETTKEVTEVGVGVVVGDRVKAEAEGVIRTAISPSRLMLFHSLPAWEKNDTRSTHSFRIQLLSPKRPY
ncbi:MAG: hypothetical protein Q8P35_03060 [Candidatus Yanofskybacteria bacterium]|nr:hypothetical protein [Candidatus Yanofskybacteria bacterium]